MPELKQNDYQRFTIFHIHTNARYSTRNVRFRTTLIYWKDMLIIL